MMGAAIRCQRYQSEAASSIQRPSRSPNVPGCEDAGFEPIRVNGLDDGDYLLEPKSPAKQQRSTEATPAFATLATDDQLADINAAMEPGDDFDGKLDPLEFVLMGPAVCRLAGGSVAALVLERVVYWLSPEKQDNLPRARPQPDPDNPCWQTPGVAGLARLLGLATDDDGRRGEKQVARGLAKLQELGLVERVEDDVDDHLPQHKFADDRRNRRLVLRLTAAAREKLGAARVLPAVPGTPVVKVWIADVAACGGCIQEVASRTTRGGANLGDGRA